MANYRRFRERSRPRHGGRSRYGRGSRTSRKSNTQRFTRHQKRSALYNDRQAKSYGLTRNKISNSKLFGYIAGGALVVFMLFLWIGSALSPQKGSDQLAGTLIFTTPLSTNATYRIDDATRLAFTAIGQGQIDPDRRKIQLVEIDPAGISRPVGEPIDLTPRLKNGAEIQTGDQEQIRTAINKKLADIQDTMNSCLRNNCKSLGNSDEGGLWDRALYRGLASLENVLIDFAHPAWIYSLGLDTVTPLDFDTLNWDQERLEQSFQDAKSAGQLPKISAQKARIVMVFGEVAGAQKPLRCQEAAYRETAAQLFLDDPAISGLSGADLTTKLESKLGGCSADQARLQSTPGEFSEPESGKFPITNSPAGESHGVFFHYEAENTKTPELTFYPGKPIYLPGWSGVTKCLEGQYPDDNGQCVNISSASDSESCEFPIKASQYSMNVNEWDPRKVIPVKEYSRLKKDLKKCAQHIVAASDPRQDIFSKFYLYSNSVRYGQDDGDKKCATEVGKYFQGAISGTTTAYGLKISKVRAQAVREVFIEAISEAEAESGKSASYRVIPVGLGLCQQPPESRSNPNDESNAVVRIRPKLLKAK